MPSSRTRTRRGMRLLVLGTLTFALAACNSGKATQPPGAISTPNGGNASPAASIEAAASSAATSSGVPGSSPPAPQASPGAAGGGQANGTTGASTALEQTFESVVADISPSVVVIETDQGLGSGIVLDGQGDIVTNAHVVGTAKSFRIATAGGERLSGTLVGSFPADDVAVVKAKDGQLRPATFGDSSRLRVGQIVLAIGNPLGLQSSVTDGIVSALGRTVNEPSGAALPNAIQTSAPINPGNSGGALVDLDGAVIGIPTLAASDPQMGGAAPGIGFAVPSNIAVDIAHQLVQDGKVVSSHRAYLGIQAADVSGGQGALVFSLQPDGPAARAGIPEDVLIVSIAGKPTPDSATLSAVLAELQPGQAVDVVYMTRDGTQKTVKVTLGELPG